MRGRVQERGCSSPPAITGFCHNFRDLLTIDHLILLEHPGDLAKGRLVSCEQLEGGFLGAIEKPPDIVQSFGAGGLGLPKSEPPNMKTR